MSLRDKLKTTSHNWTLSSIRFPNGLLVQESFPVNDIDIHAAGPGCPCQPLYHTEFDSLTLVHQAFDGREAYEEGLLKLN